MSGPVTVADGSSPLARGLLDGAGQRGGLPGIIPARAGFTRPHHRRRGRVRDHPRSRGVYSQSTTPCFCTKGSSPLARGLPGGLLGLRAAPRIIPARAGFTTDGCLKRGVVVDHPRSRGVYSHGLSRQFAHVGSSPLARGLRAADCARAARTGIIPARAGFTLTDIRRSIRPGDHPRSRGVYAARLSRRLSNEGSSPLARGLPLVAASIAYSIGIIPARAGFTATRPSWP